MNAEADAGDVVLVVSDSAAEVALVQSMLEGDFKQVRVSADPEAASDLFQEWRATVLLLAFRDLERAEQFYLGVYRRGTGRSLQIHPHRTIVLCGKEDVRKACELCRSGLMDEYVQFWPMTYDTPRLFLSVDRGLRECREQRGAARSAAALELQSYHLARHEAELTRCLQDGAGHALSTREAVASASQRFGSALDGIQAAVEPLSAWIDSVENAADPYMRSTRELMHLAARVLPHILVVDDDQFQRQLSGQILESAGYQLRYAGNGGEALHMMSKLRPDLILMDVQMPDLTGLQVMERLKADPQLADIPVIMVTGKAERDIVLGSMKLGATDFIVKPVDRMTLLGKVSRVLAPPLSGKTQQG